MQTQTKEKHMSKKVRITKNEFYKEGGLSNPKNFRKMSNGVWTYWKFII